MPYPWYENLREDENTLQQGDLIPECPILIPPSTIEGENVEVDFHQIDSIVLTQSCDLAHGKIEIVLVCPFKTLNQFLDGLRDDQKSKKGIAKIKDNLRKGFLPGYHLLNKNPEFELLQDYQVVDFRNVYGIKYSSLLEVSKNLNNRIRLLPPYREHLSQSFARYFMRVGLPQDIQFD